MALHQQRPQGFIRGTPPRILRGSWCSGRGVPLEHPAPREALPLDGTPGGGREGELRRVEGQAQEGVVVPRLPRYQALPSLGRPHRLQE